MSDRYKLIIIGAGPGGYVAAVRAAQLGVKTAIIEKEYFGGVCLNWGCIPSKALLYVTELKRKIDGSKRLGLTAENVSIDLDKLRKHKDITIKKLTGGVELLLKQNGVDRFIGTASFISANEIEVAGEEPARLEAENFIIATGASPIDLPMLKVDGQKIIGAREAIDIPDIPEKLAVIGAGPIGVELATVYKTLGSDVAVIELLDSVLPMLDADISTACEKALKKQKMEILLSFKVLSSNIEGDIVEVIVEGDGREQELRFDKVLVAAGMTPNSGGLNLEKIGVELDSRGFIRVDKQMKSNIPNIHAIGDVTGGLMLAHKASHEGIVAAEVIGGLESVVDWKAVPYAVFTDPEIAGIGLTEKEAVDSGYDIKVGLFPYNAVGKAVATLAGEGFAKVISESKTDKILGVHLFGPHSGDIIFGASILFEKGGTAEDLGHTMAIHPTLTEALMEAGLHANRKAIHILNE